MEALAGSLLGVLFGMRHACEPDHLAAISTLVAEERSARKTLLLGLFWGLGHTAALLGVAVALTVLRAGLPPGLADAFELGVALMLLALGARALSRAAREGSSGPRKLHAHGRAQHEHEAAGGHVHLGRWTLAGRPLIIGIVHGLAGSGALTAVALASLPSNAARLAYVALFGFGSILGMAALSGIAGWPLAHFGRRPAAARALAAATGLFSIGLGLFWGWPLVTRIVTAG
jgi:ABC-type nickel/cobalt efflux system permease component RcnA